MHNVFNVQAHFEYLPENVARFLECLTILGDYVLKG